VQNRRRVCGARWRAYRGTCERTAAGVAWQRRHVARRPSARRRNRLERHLGHQREFTFRRSSATLPDCFLFKQAGLEHLLNLDHLMILGLRDCSYVRDAGLRYIVNLPLQALDVTGMNQHPCRCGREYDTRRLAQLRDID
jgi:hypothetical protein